MENGIIKFVGAKSEAIEEFDKGEDITKVILTVNPIFVIYRSTFKWTFSYKHSSVAPNKV